MSASSLFIYFKNERSKSMELRKFNRKRRQVITFIDSGGVKREAVVMRDDLRSAKKPPVWMQELMRDLEELEQERKGA